MRRKHFSRFSNLANLLLLILVSGLIAQNQAGVNYFAQGEKLLKDGKWREALQTWKAGKIALDKNLLVDPRLGFHFIEIATKNSAEEFYTDACELYFWALKQTELARYETAFQSVIDQMIAILDNELYLKWQEMLKQRDTTLNEEIRDYWQQRDPTPSTPLVNERLLEHYQRIAYARKNFKKAKHKIYGTDDRGLIYIKFGQPYNITSGILGSNRLVYKRWIDVLYLYQRANRGDEERFVQAVDRYNRNPEFELWLYPTLEPDQRTFYLFGRKEGYGTFGLRNGVEELIPDSAFRRIASRYSGGITPGAILQTIYYGELMHLHDFFANRLFELDQAWNAYQSQGRQGFSDNQFADLRARFRLLEIDMVNQRNVPDARSTLDRDTPPVDLIVQSVRRLDESNQPQMAFVALTYPHAVRKALTVSLREDATGYQVVHTLRVLGETGKEIDRKVDKLYANFENITTFTFPHDRNQDGYHFIAEVFKLSEEQKLQTEASAIQPNSAARGFNDLKVAGEPPLSTEQDVLELSDLIIGVDSPTGRSRQRLKFPILPYNEIYLPQALKVYFEIYHLQKDEENRAHYTIKLQVAKLHGRKKTKKEMISLSHDFESADTRTQEQFEMDISKLASGNYELLVVVTDGVSQQNKNRFAFFTILEEDE
ncbi:MAG: GWxTD domain-containing protein [bacterium]